MATDMAAEVATHTNTIINASPRPGTAKPALPAQPASGSLGHPGRSAFTQYRRRRATELAAWTPSLTWRAPLVIAAGLVAGALVGWRLRFRPSSQARAWQRGAAGEQQTARLLDRLGRDGYVSFHDLAMPDSPANLDHLVVGPSGVFVTGSKQWTGQVHQSSDGLIWHNHYRLDRTLATLRWQAETLGRLLGAPVAPLVCVHGAHIQHGGLHAQGVAIVPATRLRRALGHDQLLPDADIQSGTPPPPGRACAPPPEPASVTCSSWSARLRSPLAWPATKPTGRSAPTARRWSSTSTPLRQPAACGTPSWTKRIPSARPPRPPRSSMPPCSPRWGPLGWRPWPSRSACCSS